MHGVALRRERKIATSSAHTYDSRFSFFSSRRVFFCFFRNKMWKTLQTSTKKKSKKLENFLLPEKIIRNKKYSKLFSLQPSDCRKHTDTENRQKQKSCELKIKIMELLFFATPKNPKWQWRGLKKFSWAPSSFQWSWWWKSSENYNETRQFLCECVQRLINQRTFIVVQEKRRKVERKKSDFYARTQDEFLQKFSSFSILSSVFSLVLKNANNFYPRGDKCEESAALAERKKTPKIRSKQQHTYQHHGWSSRRATAKEGEEGSLSGTFGCIKWVFKFGCVFKWRKNGEEKK